MAADPNDNKIDVTSEVDIAEAALIDTLLGTKNGKFARFSVAQVRDLLKAALNLGQLAGVNFPPDNGVVRVLSSTNQWLALTTSGAPAAAWSSLNGRPEDNSALTSLLSQFVTIQNPTVPTPPTTSKDGTIANTAWAAARIAALLNDGAPSGTTTYSSAQIQNIFAAGLQALRSEITNGASAALDSFGELQTKLAQDATGTATLITGMANRVRFDADQVLTPTQRTQVLKNLGLQDIDVRLLPPANQGSIGQILVKTSAGWAPADAGGGQVPTSPADPDNFALAINSLTTAGANMRAKTAALQG